MNALAPPANDLDARYGPKFAGPGGKYRATQNADGTWNIHDVPMFCEHALLPKEGGGEVKRAELAEMVATGQRQYAQDKYLPPLIVYHHGKNEPENAGFFLPKRVDAVKYQGNALDGIYFDFLFIPEHQYARIRRGELPYGSAEFGMKPPYIAHMSLLPNHAPWFKLPLLTIGEEVPFSSGQAEPERPGIMAQRRASDYLQTLQRQAKRGNMDTEKKPADTQGADNKKQDGQPDKMDAILAAQSATNEKLDKLIGLLSAKNDPKDNAGNAPVEQRKDPEPTKARDDSSTEIARLSAEVTALKTRDTEREKREQVDVLVRSGKDALKGRALPADIDAQLRRFAGLGKEHHEAFVDTLKRSLPKEPPADFNGELPADDEAAPEVMRYAQKGPDKLVIARKHAKSFAYAKDKGWLGREMTLEKYLETQPELGPAK